MATYEEILKSFSGTSDMLENIQNMNVQPSQNLMSALQATDLSPYKFSDWAMQKGYSYSYDDQLKQYSLNDIALPDAAKTILGKDYGTEQDYNNVLKMYQDTLAGQQQQLADQATQQPAEPTEEGQYVSPYQSQIQELLDQLGQFTPYETPEELEQYVFQLLQSAQQPFTYNPEEDESLKIAQKEVERQVREAAGTSNTLYSSATIGKVAYGQGALIPEYESRQYQRFADQRNREIQMVTTLMQWDQMQADRTMDQLALIQTKFDYIMKLDNQSFQAFQLMLDQRNYQREYDLQQQQLQLDRQIAEIEQAYARVDALGYVDNETAIILGMPVGTKAQWVKELEMAHENELKRIKIEFENNKKLQKEQAKIEKELIKYKNELEEASKKKLMQEQYALDKKLAEYEAKLEKGGTIKGTAGLTSTAKALIGTKYVSGGTSTKGFDCSGLTQYIMKQNGVSIPRNSLNQSKGGSYVSKGSLQPGDLIFFDTISGNGRSVDHVGIYVGNGQMIHASSGSGVVKQVSINTNYWQSRYTTARRYTASGSSSGGSSSSGSSKRT